MSRSLTPQERADRVAARQHGAIALAQALDCGLTAPQVRGRVASRRWTRPVRATFVVSGSPPTWRQSAMVACLAGPPGTVASHLTAAALHGLCAPPLLPHVTVPITSSARLPVAKVHRSRLASVDVIRVDGIPCTTPGRCLVECAALIPAERLRDLVDDAIDRRLVSVDGIEAAIGRSGLAPGRRGISTLRGLLEAWSGGIQPGSPAEVRMLRRVHEWGCPAPEVQFVVRDRQGRFVARLDLAWPASRVALEYDGRRHHGPRSFDHDERRHAALVALGWRVRHVEKSDLLPGEVRLRQWLGQFVGRVA
jgi:hypothetical protein